MDAFKWLLSWLRKTDGHCFLYRLFAFPQCRPNSIRNMLVLTVALNVSFNRFFPRFISLFTVLQHLLVNLFCDFLKNACFYFFPDTKYITQQTTLAFDLHLPGFISFIVFVEYVFTLSYLAYATGSSENQFMLLSHGWI